MATHNSGAPTSLYPVSLERELGQKGIAPRPLLLTYTTAAAIIDGRQFRNDDSDTQSKQSSCWLPTTALAQGGNSWCTPSLSLRSLTHRMLEMDCVSWLRICLILHSICLIAQAGSPDALSKTSKSFSDSFSL